MADRVTTSAAADALLVHRTQDGDRATLELDGDVDIGTSRVALDAVEVALGRGAKSVAIDLTPVRFIDSAGLSAIVGAAKRVHERGAELTTKAPHGHEARLLIDLAGLQNVLNLDD